MSCIKQNLDLHKRQSSNFQMYIESPDILGLKILQIFVLFFFFQINMSRKDIKKILIWGQFCEALCTFMTWISRRIMCIVCVCVNECRYISFWFSSCFASMGTHLPFTFWTSGSFYQDISKSCLKNNQDTIKNHSLILLRHQHHTKANQTTYACIFCRLVQTDRVKNYLDVCRYILW